MGLFFFLHLPKGLFLYRGWESTRVAPHLSCVIFLQLPLALPKPPFQGLRALLKTSLFPYVCCYNLCTILPLVEKQGLYLRGKYTCRNPALLLPAREILHEKRRLQRRCSDTKVSSTLAAGEGDACLPSSAARRSPPLQMLPESGLLGLWLQRQLISFLSMYFFFLP